MNMSKIDIEKIKSKMEKLALKYQLSLVLLFGSQVTGKTHTQSDVDIAYLSDKKMRPIEEAQMAFDFSQRLKIDNKKIDLVNLKEATPLLLKQIAEKSIPLYEKKVGSILANFKIYALRSFMDAKKLFRLKEESLGKFLKQKV